MQLLPCNLDSLLADANVSPLSDSSLLAKANDVQLHPRKIVSLLADVDMSFLSRSSLLANAAMSLSCNIAIDLLALHMSLLSLHCNLLCNIQ